MRKYFVQTYEYAKTNWVSVLLHILIPAILYTIFINPTSSFDYIMTNIKELDVQHAYQIFLTINDGSRWASWEYVLFYFLMAVATLIVFSSFIGNIQNKMRYGKTVYEGFSGVFKRTNENFFATLRAGIALVLAMEVFALVMSVVIYFIIKVTSIAALRIILVSIIGGGLIIAMFYGAAWVACVIPNMTMRNEGVFKSIKRSMTMVKEKQIKIFGNFVIPIIVCMIPLLVLSGFDIVYDHIVLTIVRYVFIFLFYIFSFAYYIIVMYVIFFDVNEIEREDLNAQNKWRI